mmetsp:Transcript_2557/g.4336  ORF Transcript_2557/g.4336 Transcript_2557/m.4336 type:complete len:222 (+) Transcript_2557:360-1025(+)
MTKLIGNRAVLRLASSILGSKMLGFRVSGSRISRIVGNRVVGSRIAHSKIVYRIVCTGTVLSRIARSSIILDRIVCNTIMRRPVRMLPPGSSGSALATQRQDEPVAMLIWQLSKWQLRASPPLSQNQLALAPQVLLVAELLNGFWLNFPACRRFLEVAAQHSDSRQSQLMKKTYLSGTCGCTTSQHPSHLAVACSVEGLTIWRCASTFPKLTRMNRRSFTW